MATPEEMLAKAKALYDAGDVASATRLAKIAKSRMAAPTGENPGPDGMTRAERIAAAKAGTLPQPSDAKLAAVDAFDKVAESRMENAPTQAGTFMANLAPGVSFGFADEIAGGIDAALTDRTYDQSVAMLRGRDKEMATAFPKTAIAGQVAGTVASPVNAALMPAKGATMAGTVANAAVAGAKGGALYGAGVGEGGFDEKAASAVKGGIGGAVLGGAIPVVSKYAQKAGEVVANVASKVISPNGGADAVRLKLVQVLDDFGVPTSAGQKVGNEALRRKEGLTAGGQKLMGDQAEAFTTAVLKTAGIDAKRATPEVLDEAATRIGAVFDDVTRGVDVTPDRNSITALSKAVNEYKTLAASQNPDSLIFGVFKDVTKAFRGGNTIPASTVNTWRSSLSKLTTSADGATREAARMALETVDDMLTASLNAAGRSDDVARLATARGEWRNFLAIQKAAVREGDGLLSPARVRANVIQQGVSSFARGKRGDLGALARAGGEVMEALPNSGTAQRWFANIPGGAQGLLAAGGATAGSTFGPLGTVAGAIGGAALPGVAGAIRMSWPVQNYLANQLASGGANLPGLADLAARAGFGALPQFAPMVGNSLAK